MNEDVKECMEIWGRYTMNVYNMKVGSDKETIYVFEDICTIENKTNKIMEAIYRNHNSTGKINIMQQNKIVILPNQRRNIPIKIKKEEEKEDGN